MNSYEIKILTSLLYSITLIKILYFSQNKSGLKAFALPRYTGIEISLFVKEFLSISHLLSNQLDNL